MNLPLKRIRLRAVWVLAPLYLLLALPSLPLLATGAALAAAGVLLRAWAAGTIRKNQVLTTCGPYAHTRNPLYLGTFLIGLGLTTAAGRVTLLLLFVAAFALIYGRTMRREERNLRQKFGAAYAAYATRVPAFLPRLQPYRPQGSTVARFEVKQYLRHREYQTGLGILIGFLVLAAKMVWL